MKEIFLNERHNILFSYFLKSLSAASFELKNYNKKDNLMSHYFKKLINLDFLVKILFYNEDNVFVQ
jgi:hypothetical protein